MDQQRIKIHEAYTEEVACTLGSAEATEQKHRWEAVRDRYLLGCEPLADGLHLRFAPEGADAIHDVVARESACCGFIRFAVAEGDDAVTVEITGSGDAQARAVIHLFAEQLDLQ